MRQASRKELIRVLALILAGDMGLLLDWGGYGITHRLMGLAHTEGDAAFS